MKLHVVALCGLLSAAPVFAAPADNVANGAAAPAAASPAPQSAAGGDQAHAQPRQICRRIDSDMSRRLGSRVVCHTAQEWREIQQD